MEENAQEELLMSIFITTARVYDVLMADLSQRHPKIADDLLEIHSAGALMGPVPAYTGQFITTEANAEETVKSSEEVDLTSTDQNV